jgi:5-methylcytosine-specific restriction endonuclease McrA
VIPYRFRPRKCKHCRESFMPERQGQVVHMSCVEGYVAVLSDKKRKKEEAKRKAAAKVERAQIRRRKQELKSVPQLIADAQVAFNAFIRERDKDKGCFVCGQPFAPVDGRVQHAGHVRSRGAAGHLRFTEDNCMGECEGCNGPYGAKPHEIKAGAIARIGAERYAELEADNTPHKWKREELLEIKALYQRKLKELKERD